MAASKAIFAPKFHPSDNQRRPQWKNLDDGPYHGPIERFRILYSDLTNLHVLDVGGAFDK